MNHCVRTSEKYLAHKVFVNLRILAALKDLDTVKILC